MCSKLKPVVKDLTKYAETLRSNQQVFETILTHPEIKSAVSPYQPGESAERDLGEDPQENINLYATWAPRGNSPLQTKSPLTPFDLHSAQERRTLEARRGEEDLMDNAELFQVSAHYQSAFDTIGQKIKHLRTTANNFVNSCEKVLMNNEPRGSAEEKFLLQVYDNEKRLFENYLNSLANFVIQTKNDRLKISQGNVERNSRSKERAMHRSPDVRMGHQYGVAAEISPDKLRTNYRSVDKYTIQNRVVSPMGRRTGAQENLSPGQKSKTKELITSLLEKVKDLDDKNNKFKKENSQLTKISKKLELKANERKKTLKQLFELVTEKDKELNFYKSNYGNAKQQPPKSSETPGDDNIKLLSKKISSEDPDTLRLAGSEEFAFERNVEVERTKQSAFRGRPTTNKAGVESNVEELTEKNKALEEQCQGLVSEIEMIRDHKQKIEKTYKEEVALLNDKLKQLSEYNQTLEAKNNDRLKESLSPNVYNFRIFITNYPQK